MYGGGPQQYGPRSFDLTGIEPIGNYGLQPVWADGHAYGIWMFDRLRAFCPCCR